MRRPRSRAGDPPRPGPGGPVGRLLRVQGGRHGGLPGRGAHLDGTRRHAAHQPDRRPLPGRLLHRDVGVRRARRGTLGHRHAIRQCAAGVPPPRGRAAPPPCRPRCSRNARRRRHLRAARAVAGRVHQPELVVDHRHRHVLGVRPRLPAKAVRPRPAGHPHRDRHGGLGWHGDRLTCRLGGLRGDRGGRGGDPRRLAREPRAAMASGLRGSARPRRCPHLPQPRAAPDRHRLHARHGGRRCRSPADEPRVLPGAGPRRGGRLEPELERRADATARTGRRRPDPGCPALPRAPDPEPSDSRRGRHRGPGTRGRPDRLPAVAAARRG